MCICIHSYIYIYICMFVYYICVYLNTMYIRICVYSTFKKYVYICVYLYLFFYLYAIYVFFTMYICIFICICIYIYPQTGTFADPQMHPSRAFVPFLPGRVLAFGLFFLHFLSHRVLLYILDTDTYPNLM